MAPSSTGLTKLSRRERQIMDIIYRRGAASAAEVHAELPDAPSYSAVRSALRLLVQRGQLKHEQQGPRYIYKPTVPREQARRSAIAHLVRTFFNGSRAQAAAAILEMSDTRLSEDDLKRLTRLVKEARRQGDEK
jgi:predicted transcriptional regulator